MNTAAPILHSEPTGIDRTASLLGIEPASASTTRKLDVILEGDCLLHLKTIASESVDLLCSDVPYGIEFMGKDWDRAVPSVEVWRECYRVLKPGAFALVMSSPRQDVLARMIVNLGDAGFDTSLTAIHWTHAQGFPKASNIAKAADRRAEASGTTPPAGLNGAYAGYQPKPAVEVVLVVMKPLSERTYLDQALANGKGVTWLDDCRIPVKAGDTPSAGLRTATFGQQQTVSGGNGSPAYTPNEAGRFPSNLLVSDAVLDDGTVTKSNPVKGGGLLNGGGVVGSGLHGGGIKERVGSSISDSGGYSRYFDLDAWWEDRVDELPEGVRKTLPFLRVPKPTKQEKTLESGDRNDHPTVKPLTLMSYLITLASRPGDVVLDPYAGSGTTCVAAKMLGRHFIGIEREPDYAAIARDRVASAASKDAWALRVRTTDASSRPMRHLSVGALFITGDENWVGGAR